ncbi:MULTISPECIES: McrC family protein [Clostridium]|uniref:McrC family protein n=1 Tax=Clostridium frigoriphilum TaxID=443253 RepID=A0ABU7UWV4_9CLOT|nr:McrC family protein [Clostridium sp. DSM 17811]
MLHRGIQKSYIKRGENLSSPRGRIDINLRGYFFDMNAFFETLIGRLLQNFSEGYSVKDQYSLHDMFIYTSRFNPYNRKSPTPRPDFALMKEGRVVKVLDAKCRDLWERSLPAKMLYQLAIYAVSGIGDKTATIVYPTLSDIPTTAHMPLYFIGRIINLINVKING